MPNKKPYRKQDKYWNEKQLARDLGSGLNDVIGRGTLAGLLGTPADLGNMLWNGATFVNNKISDLQDGLGLGNGNRQLPYQEQAYMGAEDIGNRMQKAGLVSPERRPKTELLASLVSPGAVLKTALNAPKTAVNALKALERLDESGKGFRMADGRYIPNGQAGIFAGINARNAPKEALEQGAKLLDEGADPRKVWKDLGVFKGADGKMRWEIDDSKMIQKPIGFFNTDNRTPLIDSLTHDELYDAYGRIKATQLGEVGLGAKGSWEERVNQLNVTPMFSRERYSDTKHYNRIAGDQKSTVAHELQHAVQSREGFSNGGNKSMFEPVYNYDDVLKKAERVFPDYVSAYKAADGADINSPEMVELERAFTPDVRKFFEKNLKETTPHEQYMRLAGEAEARATQARLPLNAEQRRNVYPFDSYDVPIDELIHTQNDGVAQSVGNLSKLVAPQDEALRVAQANAAKPVSEGGLGLRLDNTPEERASAMGFDVNMPLYHGTGADIQAFDQRLAGKNDGGLWGRGQYLATSPESASRYAFFAGSGENVIPAYAAVKRPMHITTGSDLITRMPDGTNTKDLVGDNLDGSKIKEIAQAAGHDGVFQFKPNGGVGDIVTYDPSTIRSRFAAFDPMRKDSSDLLAGLAPLGLGALIAPREKKKKKQP